MFSGRYKQYKRRYKCGYLPVGNADAEIDDLEEGKIKLPNVFVFIILLFFLAAISFFEPIFDRLNTSSISFPACLHPVLRREWRALSLEERTHFFSAINCLSTKPSQFGLNGSLYDDFAALHGNIGSWCHRSSSFLPWHRYTLHLWEKALREHCGFGGQIPYWDWSLDWRDLANSSIWDGEIGFGGDGDKDTPITVGEGRCVTDGPFTNLRPVRYNHTHTTHCLSRGFRDGNHVGRLPAAPFSPDVVGALLQEKTYTDFVQQVEYSVHNTMHQSIAGDFLALTAANDPIFFVHHAQLDRLWWQWQQRDPQVRLLEYHGKHMFNSTGNATLTDPLMVGGFAADIPVAQVMDIQGGFLCYQY